MKKPKPAVITAVKPKTYTPSVLRGVPEGIHPVHTKDYFRSTSTPKTFVKQQGSTNNSVTNDIEYPDFALQFALAALADAELRNILEPERFSSGGGGDFGGGGASGSWDDSSPGSNSSSYDSSPSSSSYYSSSSSSSYDSSSSSSSDSSSWSSSD